MIGNSSGTTSLVKTQFPLDDRSVLQQEHTFGSGNPYVTFSTECMFGSGNLDATLSGKRPTNRRTYVRDISLFQTGGSRKEIPFLSSMYVHSARNAKEISLLHPSGGKEIIFETFQLAPAKEISKTFRHFYQGAPRGERKYG